MRRAATCARYFEAVGGKTAGHLHDRADSTIKFVLFRANQSRRNKECQQSQSELKGQLDPNTPRVASGLCLFSQVWSCLSPPRQYLMLCLQY